MSAPRHSIVPAFNDQRRNLDGNALPESSRRFALVCPNYYPITCGIGDFSMRVARELLGRGAQVALFTQAPAEANPECPSVSVHAADGRTPLETTRAMRDLIFDFKPTDVVVNYIPHMLRASRFGSPAMPILMAEMRDKARVTTIFHELYLAWSWRPDLALGAALQRLQFSAALGASDRIFVTTAARKRALETIPCGAGRQFQFELLFIGANAPPLPRCKVAGPRRLGIFSMLNRGRRFDLMIEAFAIINRQHPDTELVLIGNMGNDASPAYRALKQHISTSPVAKKVRLTGPLPLWKAAEEIAALDIYLFPDEGGATTRSSTLPIALGSGIPVVATSGADTDPDFFVDGRNVAFAQSMTAQALASATLRVLDEPDWADNLSKGGLSLYEQHLSWPAIADHLLPRSS